MNRDDYLFSSHDLRAVLENQKNEIIREIDTLPSERVLNTGPEEWTAYFREKYEVESLKLDETAIYLEQGEAEVDVSHDPNRMIFDRSRPFYLTGTAITFCIPFVGDPQLFRCQASTHTVNPPRGVLRENELLVRYVRLDHNAEAVKGEFERDLGTIKQHLEWIVRDDRTVYFSDSGACSPKTAVAPRQAHQRPGPCCKPGISGEAA